MYNFENIWKYRHMIKKLTMTNLKIKYKSSALGLVWALLEPLLLFAVLYFVFANLLKPQIEHYPLYLFAGLVCWNFFDRATSTGLQSMLGHAELIKKLYFPREVLVISSCLTALVMAFFEFIVFLIFTLLSNVALSTTLLIVPIIIFLEFILALGVALPLSAMNTAYRDVQYIWRILLQVGFFITPIIYSITIFPPEYRQAVMLNPVARLIDMVRATAIYATLPSVNSFIYVALFSLISLIVGMFIFRKYEWKLAEEV